MHGLFLYIKAIFEYETRFVYNKMNFNNIKLNQIFAVCENFSVSVK